MQAPIIPQIVNNVMEGVYLAYWEDTLDSQGLEAELTALLRRYTAAATPLSIPRNIPEQ